MKKYLALHYGARLRKLRHLNRSIVFAIDLLLACAGMFLSFAIISLLIGELFSSRAASLMLLSLCVSAGLFLLTGSYRTSIRFSTLRELGSIFRLLALKAAVMAGAVVGLGILDVRRAVALVLTDMAVTSFLMIFSRSLMINVYYSVVNTEEENTDNVLIYGASGSAPLMAAQINDNRRSSYRVMGFLDVEGEKKRSNIKILGLSVYNWDGDFARLEGIIAGRGITHVLFTNNTDFNRERDGLVDFCIGNNIHMLMVGEIQPLDKNKRPPRQIKQIDIEDLLYREEIKTEEGNVARQVDGKVVLVTGAAGSIGRGIARRLLEFNPQHLVLLDIAETPLHDLELELARAFPGRNISFVLCDVRSKNKMGRVFDRYKPNFVFHAAAYKHVPVIESNPCEGVMTNIWGTINTAHNAICSGVEKFVMISTDKAVNPTNVMGASKRIAELWVRGLADNTAGTRFIITRFGNVLGSNGSVIPIFREQIAAGGPVTVTHPEMTRYFMTIPEACRLVLQAAAMGSGDEIFVFDMGQQVKIDTLARRMILLSGLMPDEDIMVEYTGLRPGEKLYEELLSEAEQTELTHNEKIRIVMADRIEMQSIEKNVAALVKSAVRGEEMQSVKLMKRLIPEFKSNNSQFEIFDREEQPAMAYGGR